MVRWGRARAAWAVWVAVGVFVGWAGVAAGAGAEEKKAEVTISVQGVLASRGKDAQNPEIDASLAAYRDVLRRFGFGKYENIGHDHAAARLNQNSTLKVGSYTVQLMVLKFEAAGPRVNYTVYDSRGQAVGTSTMVMQPNAVLPVQVGDPTVPVILLFQASGAR